jgi:hypothetical protein
MKRAARTTAGRLSALLAVLLLIAAAAGRTTAGAEDTTLPTPPRQAEPWAAPRTSLPRFLVSATAALYQQGLADPRGCEYRTIKVVAGSVWRGTREVGTTSGWVLPVADAGKRRHAIAWSGLVYPLAELGAPADLDADVRGLAGAGRANGAAKDPPDQRRGFDAFGTNNEGSAIAIESLLPIKICLLLRLGRADLAEMVWAAGTGLSKGAQPAGPEPKLDLNSYGLSYLSLARDLAWFRFDRAICAHMRGDDALALADARALDALALAVDAKAEAMGFSRPDRPVPAGQLAPYIEFLDQLPELRADQERRARDRANPPAPIQDEGEAGRALALIRDIDQVAVRQWSQPGGVILGESPIIKDLIALGDPAVGPLIRAFRFDDRLTRSVGFHRDFSRNRNILRVDQAVYAALTGILKTTNFAPPAPNDAGRMPMTREALADQIQAYWEKNRLIPVVERWYRTLADDELGEAAWLEAAGSIVQPENVQNVPSGGAFAVTLTTPVKPGEHPPFRGESLRKGHEPTVASLMARRVESMLKSPEGQRFELLAPCRMAAILADWDPIAGAQTFRELTRICRQRYARPDNGHDWTNQNLAVSIARFTMARLKAGDQDAAPEYAEWIRTTSPDWLGESVLAALEPLYRRPDDPTLAATAAWLFGNPQSAWVPLIGPKGPRRSYEIVKLIASPMVEVPAFRKMLALALDDRSPVGNAEIGDNGSVKVDVEGGFSTSGIGPKNDRDAPPRGTKVPIRLCDIFAWQLAALDGAPAFNLCWPEPKRNAVLAAMADFLRRKDAR